MDKKSKSPLEIKHKMIVEALESAKKGDKLMAFGLLTLSRGYSFKEDIPFSMNDYWEKIEKAYYQKGIEEKIKENLRKAYLLASEGSKDYLSHIDEALGYSSEFKVDSKREYFESKIINSRNPLKSIYKNIGLLKLKKIKSEEIKNYARIGDFRSMSQAIKSLDNGFKFSFTNDEISRFYRIYNEEGSANRIDFLLNSASIKSKKMDYDRMTEDLKEAKSLSKKVGFYEFLFTWFRERKIKKDYLNNLKNKHIPAEDEN